MEMISKVLGLRIKVLFYIRCSIIIIFINAYDGSRTKDNFETRKRV